MAKLKISGLPPYDGEYEVPTPFTNGEYHRIWQISGVTAGQFSEALETGNVGAIVALSAIVLERHDKKVDLKDLWDANLEDNFDFEKDEEPEDSDRPPATATSGGNENEPVAVANKNEPTASSGNSGQHTGAPIPPTPLLTGDLGSVERVASA